CPESPLHRGLTPGSRSTARPRRSGFSPATTTGSLRLTTTEYSSASKRARGRSITRVSSRSTTSRRTTWDHSSSPPAAGAGSGSDLEVEVAGGDPGVAGVADGGAHVAGDERLVHFVGPVDEAGRAGVLHHPLQWRIGRVAERAVHLDRTVDDLPEHVR